MLGRRTAAPAASAAPVDFAGEVLALAESVASRARLLRSKRSRAGALARHAQLVAAQLASMVDSVRDEDTLAVLVQAQSMLAAIDLFLGETAAMTFMQQTGSAGRTARAIRDYAAQLLRTEKSLELVSETLLPAAANTKTPNPKSPASPTIVKLARESVEMTTAVYANQRAATALASRAELVALAVADQSYDSHDHAAQEGLDKLMATLTAIQRFIARTAAKCVLHQLLLARTAADIIRDLDEQISHVLPMLRLALMLRAGTVAKAIEQDASEMPDLVKRLVSDAQIKFNVPQQRIETILAIKAHHEHLLLMLPKQLGSRAIALFNATVQDIMATAGRKLAPQHDWSIDPDFVDIFTSQRVGSGFLGQFNYGAFLGEQVAVKFIDEALDTQSISAIGKLASVWHSLRHPNVLPLRGVCLNADKPFIVTQLVRDTVAGFLRKAPDTPIAMRIRVLLNAAFGMLYLHEHSPPIVHGDITATNVLVDDDGRVYVSGFGLASIKSLEPAGFGNEVGATLGLEIGVDKRVHGQGPPSDVLSFGVMMHQVISGNLPFGGDFVSL